MKDALICFAFGILCFFGSGYYSAYPEEPTGLMVVFIVFLFALGAVMFGGALDRLTEWKKAKGFQSDFLKESDTRDMVHLLILVFVLGGLFAFSGTGIVGFLPPFLAGCTFLFLFCHVFLQTFRKPIIM